MKHLDVLPFTSVDASCSPSVYRPACNAYKNGDILRITLREHLEFPEDLPTCYCYRYPEGINLYVPEVRVDSIPGYIRPVDFAVNNGLVFFYRYKVLVECREKECPDGVRPYMHSVLKLRDVWETSGLPKWTLHYFLEGLGIPKMYYSTDAWKKMHGQLSSIQLGYSEPTLYECATSVIWIPRNAFKFNVVRR